MKKTFKQRLVMLAALLIVAATSTQAAFAAVGGRPANPDPNNPRTQSIFIYDLKGGESKKDQIYLSNNGEAAETVQLFPVDGTVSNTGAFTCEQNVEPRDDVGAWLKLDKTEVTVEAQGSAVVDFSLEVPAKVDVGEHNGCIAIQVKDDQGQRTGSIQVITRQAARVAVVVPGDIHRQVTIEDFNAHGGFKDAKITFGLKNEGNVSADVQVDVGIRDLFGNQVAYNGGQYVVIADTTFGVNYDNPYRPFFGGWYKVKASISYDKRAGSFGLSDQGQLLHDTSPERIIYIAPSIWFFVLLGVLIVLAAAYVFWKRRAKAAAKGSLGGKQAKGKSTTGQVMWGAYEVKEGDTLESLAKKNEVSAEKVATLNKLSSHKLEVGQKIYLPRRK